MNSENDNDTQIASRFDQQIARLAVGGYDDMQEPRKSFMNQIRDLVRKINEGIPFDEVEEEKDADERSYGEKYSDDKLPELIEQMEAEGKLTRREKNYLTKMLDAVQVVADAENRFNELMEISQNEKIYQEFLKHVYGVSWTLTARLMNQYSYCEDFPKVSNLWSYSGLAPGQERKRGEKLGYNPKAKTLAWLIADRMIMQGDKSFYKTEFYDPYKKKQLRRMERKENGRCVNCRDELPGADSDQKVTGTKVHECQYEYEVEDEVKPCGFTSMFEKEASEHRLEQKEKFEESHDIAVKVYDVCRDCLQMFWEHGDDPPSAPNSRGHADTRARRYMAKKFLKHYWYHARDMQGLPTPEEWVVAHGGHEKRTDTFENPVYALESLYGRASDEDVVSAD